LQPDIELRQGLDDVHAGLVTVRLHAGNIAMNDEGPRRALPSH
jgi:hypothetical protein